eukprot:362847-Amphidinium_carterae.1
MQTAITVQVYPDHAGCPLTRHSTSGVVTQCGMSTLCRSTWLSTVSLCTAESEYCAIAEGIVQTMYCVALARDYEIPWVQEKGCKRRQAEVRYSSNELMTMLPMR